MSTEAIADVLLTEGAPELTQLGKRLEILRIERGVSKQHLARHAGTSRQQLWRVMTGKSELTSSLRERLAFALSVEPAALAQFLPPRTDRPAEPAPTANSPLLSTPSIVDYLTDPQHLAATIRTLPTGDAGRRLKRALLNAVEDLAVESGQPLSLDYSEIRRRVLSGEL